MRPHNPVICATGALLIGVMFLLGPNGWFRSTSYDVAFELGRRNWGFAFAATGIAVLATWQTRLSFEACACLFAVFTAWTFCLLWAIHEGSSAGYTGPVLWGMVVTMLGASLSRYGPQNR